MKNATLKSKLGFAALAVAALAPFAASFASEVPTERLEARRQFSDLKFGIFIHWGFYTTYAQGEWYLERAGLRGEDYEHAANAFYPHDFDAMDGAGLSNPPEPNMSSSLLAITTAFRCSTRRRPITISCRRRLSAAMS